MKSVIILFFISLVFSGSSNEFYKDNFSLVLDNNCSEKNDAQVKYTNGNINFNPGLVLEKKKNKATDIDFRISKTNMRDDIKYQLSTQNCSAYRVPIKKHNNVAGYGRIFKRTIYY